MAIVTVKELDEERRREDMRDEARRELRTSMARFAMAEMAGSGRSHVALLDGRLRSEVLESARLGLEAAYGKDASAPGEPSGIAVQLRAGGRVAARAVGLNFGAKRIERTTRAAGEDLEACRAETDAAAGASLSAEPARTDA